MILSSQKLCKVADGDVSSSKLLRRLQEEGLDSENVPVPFTYQELACWANKDEQRMTDDELASAIKVISCRTASFRASALRAMLSSSVLLCAPSAVRSLPGM